MTHPFPTRRSSDLRAVDDEHQRLARALAQVDRGADGAQIMRAGTRRDDDQLGDRNHALDRHGDRRRRVDDRELEALLAQDRSEEHTSELQSLMPTSYAVFCLIKKTKNHINT